MWSEAAMVDQLSEMEQSETICTWSLQFSLKEWIPRKPLKITISTIQSIVYPTKSVGHWVGLVDGPDGTGGLGGPGWQL